MTWTPAPTPDISLVTWTPDPTPERGVRGVVLYRPEDKQRPNIWVNGVISRKDRIPRMMVLRKRREEEVASSGARLNLRRRTKRGTVAFRQAARKRVMFPLLEMARRRLKIRPKTLMCWVEFADKPVTLTWTKARAMVARGHSSSGEYELVSSCGFFGGEQRWKRGVWYVNHVSLRIV